MKSTIDRSIKLEMNEQEFQALCEIIDYGRDRIEAGIKDLENDVNEVILFKRQKYLMEYSKYFTNIRASL